MDLLALSLPYWHVWIAACYSARTAAGVYYARWRQALDNQITVGRIYRVLVTENTNNVAEEIRMNIAEKRAVVVSADWFDVVKVRVNTEARIWTDIIELNTSDLQAI